MLYWFYFCVWSRVRCIKVVGIVWVVYNQKREKELYGLSAHNNPGNDRSISSVENMERVTSEKREKFGWCSRWWVWFNSENNDPQLWRYIN